MANGTKGKIATSIITALITAVAAVLVSFIGIVPNLRHDDSKKIDELKQMITQLESDKTTSENNKPHISINGKVYKNQNHTIPLNNVEVYLLPADKNELMTLVDSNGVFSFKNIVEQDWDVLIRNNNPNQQSSGRFLLQLQDGNLSIPGAYLHYSVEK